MSLTSGRRQLETNVKSLLLLLDYKPSTDLASFVLSSDSSSLNSRKIVFAAKTRYSADRKFIRNLSIRLAE